MHNAALKTLEIEPDTGTLKGWLAAFEKTLVPNLSPEQFADMYAQTLTYGLVCRQGERRGGPGLTPGYRRRVIAGNEPFPQEALLPSRRARGSPHGVLGC